MTIGRKHPERSEKDGMRRLRALNGERVRY